MTNLLKTAIEKELAESRSHLSKGDHQMAFAHLERAHVLGQGSTYQHTRIHWRMFRLGVKMHSLREIWGQFVRIVGAATKTPFGIYPTGNTGGANVWFFKPMPVASDLQEIMDKAKVR